MALFATLERDSPEADKLITLAHLAADYQEKLSSNTDKAVVVVIYGYLTTNAASDSLKEEIERNLMNRSIGPMVKTLTQIGVPIDKLYIADYVFSDRKGRKIDLFLQQQGESRHVLPSNPTEPGRRIPQVNIPKPVRDSKVTLDSGKELILEVTARTIKSGKRTVVPELSLKTTTGISPVAISKGFGAELVVWKPKLESLLRKIGKGGIADKVEFALKIVGVGKMSKEFADQISIEIAASLKAALTFDITIPGTSYELPVELSYSYGAAYRDGTIGDRGQGMVTITLFRFKGL
jgi:hypothetical protein